MAEVLFHIAGFGAGMIYPSSRTGVIQGSFPGGWTAVCQRLKGTVQLTSRGGTLEVPRTLQMASATRGQRLPEAVQRSMESLFGTDFSDVRIQVGPQASALGALAFVRGSEIYFAPGQYEPATARGRRLLAHELTHVLQQKSGRARNPFASGVALVYDPLLEAEAERMGLRSATERTSPPPSRTSGPHLRGGLLQPALRNSPSRVIQPLLLLNKKILSIGDASSSNHLHFKTLKEALEYISANIKDQWIKIEFDEYMETGLPRLLHVLEKWIQAPSHKSISLEQSTTIIGKALKARERHYQSVDELAMALLGESHSKPKKTQEKLLATEIVQSEKIRAGLIGIITQAIPKALFEYKIDLGGLNKLKPKNRRTYLEWVRKKTSTELLDVLTAPKEYTFAELVAAIHDVQELLYQAKNEELLQIYKEESERNKNNPHALPPERYLGTGLDGMGLVTRTPVDRAWRGPNATPRPSNPHVAFALKFGNPTDMGPSMTAARMFILAERGQAKIGELEILAKAIFAFWNRSYRRDITDVHRYHFTMDMAANFGVHYNPFMSLDPRERERIERFNLREVRSEFDYEDSSDDDL